MPAKVFAAVAWMAMSAAAFQYQPGSPCDFSGLDLDSPINRMIQELPESELRWSPYATGQFLGVEFHHLNISGLNKLHRYGAISPFCVNGTRMIEVDFVQLGDVAMTVPWETCKGRKGHIQLRSRLSRFTTVFRVEATELGQVIKLVHEGPTIPVTTEELRLRIYNGGFMMDILTEYLSIAFRAVLQDIWNKEFFTFFVTSVGKVLA
uniref:Putative secreted protein n=1 Tax=Amblyomma cajennense TaxID=34607 RepID=A0A023FQV4_AMBCJ